MAENVPGRPNNKVANSLVAMSSAAVLAVYAAGFTRTRTAADRLEAQSAERRPAISSPPRTAPVSPVPSVAAEVRPATALPELPASLPALRPGAVASKASARTTVLESLPATPAASMVSEAAPAASVEPKVEVASAPAVVTAPATTAPLVSPVVAPTVTPVAPAVLPVPAAPLAAAAAPAKWKDGTYLGWGTSRHGDIQASVVIEGGRIASATIAQCWTRYSCNVISQLPPQVAQRQSPEVDFVSGATQSANAFYYGVVDALSKAK